MPDIKNNPGKIQSRVVTEVMPQYSGKQYLSNCFEFMTQALFCNSQYRNHRDGHSWIATQNLKTFYRMWLSFSIVIRWTLPVNYGLNLMMYNLFTVTVRTYAYTRTHTNKHIHRCITCRHSNNKHTSAQMFFSFPRWSTVWQTWA